MSLQEHLDASHLAKNFQSKLKNTEGVEEARLEKEIDLQGVHWDFDRSIPQ